MVTPHLESEEGNVFSEIYGAILFGLLLLNI